MKIYIRSADIISEKKLIINTLSKLVTKVENENRYEWLYKRNPHGNASVWIAIEEKNEKIIGICSAFPRLMRVKGADITCWNLGDFSIDRSYRSLGPGIQLQKIFIESVRKGNIKFFYDHPSTSMLAIYRRIGISVCGNIIRFVKPLKIDKNVDKYFSNVLSKKIISAAGNFVLKLKDLKRIRSCNADISKMEESFNEEFNELFNNISKRYAVCGNRTSEYLNWKYIDNPIRQYEIWTLRKQGKLQGYAVVTIDRKDAILVDLFGEENQGVLEYLIITVIKMLRLQEVETVSMPLLNSNSLIPLVRRNGFYKRESSPFVVYSSSNWSGSSIVNERQNWFLTHSDRD